MVVFVIEVVAVCSCITRAYQFLTRQSYALDNDNDNATLDYPLSNVILSVTGQTDGHCSMSLSLNPCFHFVCLALCKASVCLSFVLAVSLSVHKITISRLTRISHCAVKPMAVVPVTLFTYIYM